MLPDFLLRKQTGELEIVTGDEPFTVTPQAGPGDYTVSRLDNSAAVTVTGTDLTIPILSGVSASVSGTSATLSWSTNEGEGTAYWVCTSSSIQPTVTQIAAGQDHTGAPGDASGTQPVTAPGAQADQTISNVPAGNYHFHLFQRDVAANESAIASTPFSIVPADTQAPTLSGVAVGLSGSTATLSWSTDEGNGTAYWVCTTAATVPSINQIIAGQSHTGAAATSSGVQVVSIAGAQADQVVTGLAAGPSYFFHLLHRDANGNTSNISSTTGVTVSGASATINIVRRSALEIAPEAVSFDISLSGFDTSGPSGGDIYDPRLHELYYFWDFGDPGTFSAPVNLKTEHMNSNLAYGPLVGHTFRSQGSYNVSCLVVEPSSGKSATASLTVTVGDPESVFAGSNTIVVDTTGAGDATSFDSAIGQIRGQQNTPRRIILTRGQTFTFSGTSLGGSTFSSVPSLHIVASDGAGAKPVIVANGGIVWQDTTNSGVNKDFVIQNIQADGGWDSATESGPDRELVHLFVNPPQHFLIDACEFEGFKLVYKSDGQDPSLFSTYTTINDTVITNWKEYASYTNVGHHVLTGNRMSQDVDALSGGPRDGTHNTQGPVRFGRPVTTVIHGNDMFSRCGWTTNSAGDFITQPCVRWNSTPQEGAMLNMQCNALEGGYGVIELKSGIADANSVRVNALIEKNVLVGNTMSHNIIGLQFGGTTIRNNVMIFPNTPTMPSLNPARFINLSSRGSDPQNFASPIRIYNNNMTSLMVPANFDSGQSAAAVEFDQSNGGAFTNVVSTNNLTYQPNLGQNAYNPVNTTVLWTPRYNGYDDFLTPARPQYATPANTVATYGAAAGSSALGAATSGLAAYDDLYGNPRPQLPSRGATEIA
ncbi:MAG: PKD domain-containing protein [Pseudomonadota bacterium]